MNLSEFQLHTPEEMALHLAGHLRRLRLQHRWKQSTLAERAGVSLPTLRRFEQSGLISLKHLLRLAFALGRLEDFCHLLEPSAAGSLKELEAIAAMKETQRGVR